MTEITFQEVLTNFFEYSMKDMHTALPAVVIGVHDSFSGFRVDVQPSVQYTDEDGDDPIDYPPILNIPVAMPMTPRGGISFPVAKGDPVLLVFLSRGIDVWKTGDGMPAPPSDRRRFDLRDCIAITGIFPLSMSPNFATKHTLPHSPTDVVVCHNIGTGNEAEVRITPSGEVRITAKNLNISAETIRMEGDLDIEGDITISGELDLDGIILNDHIHPVTGSTTEGPENG